MAEEKRIGLHTIRIENGDWIEFDLYGVIEAEDALALIRVRDEQALSRGRLFELIDMRGVTGMSAEARSVSRKRVPTLPPYWLAIIVKSSPIRVIMDLAFRAQKLLFNHTMTYRFFDDPDDA